MNIQVVKNSCFDAVIYAAYGALWVGGAGQQYALYSVAVSITKVAFELLKRSTASSFPVQYEKAPKFFRQPIDLRGRKVDYYQGQKINHPIAISAAILAEILMEERTNHYMENCWEIITEKSINDESYVKEIINSFIEKEIQSDKKLKDSGINAHVKGITSQEIKDELNLTYESEVIFRVIEKFLFFYIRTNRKDPYFQDVNSIRARVDDFAEAHINHEKTKRPNTMKFLAFFIPKVVLHVFVQIKCLKLIKFNTFRGYILHCEVFPIIISSVIKSGWNKVGFLPKVSDGID